MATPPLPPPRTLTGPMWLHSRVGRGFTANIPSASLTDSAPWGGVGVGGGFERYRRFRDELRGRGVRLCVCECPMALNISTGPGGPTVEAY